MKSDTPLPASTGRNPFVVRGLRTPPRLRRFLEIGALWLRAAKLRATRHATRIEREVPTVFSRSERALRWAIVTRLNRKRYDGPHPSPGLLNNVNRLQVKLLRV
jgi:hypothetical protein